MKKQKIFEALEEHIRTKADEKAGYPPNCNEGYVEKDGKCVPVNDSEGGDKKNMPHNEDDMKMEDKKKKKDQDKKDAGYKKKM
jgi:hypothetical protein|tara:strand:- start:473 stop:721 length:249 start_codon:yes stop_codon:yes gene_type:complete